MSIDKLPEINCIFCGKDMQNEKFRVDYQLLAWQNDPEDPGSMNKIAKPAHESCFNTFILLNFEELKYRMLEMIEKYEEKQK